MNARLARTRRQPLAFQLKWLRRLTLSVVAGAVAIGAGACRDAASHSAADSGRAAAPTAPDADAGAQNAMGVNMDMDAMVVEDDRADAGPPVPVDTGAAGADGADAAALPRGGQEAPAPDAGTGSAPQDGGVATAELQARDRARVLLSGHSLTDNPVGDYLAWLAQQHRRDYGWEQQIVIGSPLRYRTRGPDSSDPSFGGYSLGKNREGSEKNLLRELAMPTAIEASERYDTLVVTERHDILDVIVWEDTIPLLRHFHDRVLEHESQARTLFYQSWPSIERSDPQPWIAYQTKERDAWECAASKVNLSLQRDGAQPTVSVLPVAVALAKFLERVLSSSVPGVSSGQADPLDVVFTDDVHLTALGAFVAAAATYSSVFSSSPAGVDPPADIDAAAAKVAADVAWEVVSSYLRTARAASLRSMEECRTLLATLCPDYMAMRERDDTECSVWPQADGPLGWPDSSFPLPAP